MVSSLVTCHLSLFVFSVQTVTAAATAELIHLKPVRRVLFVLGADVAAGAGKPGTLVLRAFEDHLNAIAFLSHGRECGG